jgi:hypothetical protein
MRTWRTDLAIAYPGAPVGALVHGGFFVSYNASDLARNVTAAVRALLDRHPGAPVYVTGHRCAAGMCVVPRAAGVCCVAGLSSVGAPAPRRAGGPARLSLLAHSPILGTLF